MQLVYDIKETRKYWCGILEGMLGALKLQVQYAHNSSL